MSKYCTNCGFKNIDEAKFCGKCGSKFYIENLDNNDATNKRLEKPAQQKLKYDFDGEIISYASLDEFKNDYIFLSKHFVRGKADWIDYKIDIDENIFYLIQNTKVVIVIKIEELKDIENISYPSSSKQPTYNGVSWWWWKLWAWLGLTLRNLMIFAQLEDMPEVALLFVLINTVLMILILNYNKYAFLIATVLSINPILWIINGIYLKNRWCDPKVNNGVRC